MFRNRPLPSWFQEMAKEFMTPPQFFRGVLPVTTEHETSGGTPSPTPHEAAGLAYNGARQRESGNPAPFPGEFKSVYSGDSNRHRAPRVATVSNRRQLGVVTKPKRAVKATQSIDSVHVAQLRKYGAPPHLEQTYGWDIDGVEPLQGAIRVNTKSGVYVVKRTSIAPSRIRFIEAALDYAAAHNFERFGDFVVTKNGQPYVISGEATYYATNWIQGQTVNFSSTQQVGQVAHALAQFHESTRGFTSEAYNPGDEHDLYQTLTARRQDLRSLLRQAAQKRYMDDFDQIFVRLGPVLQSDAEKSLKLIGNDQCTGFLRRVASHPGLCHLDVIPGNFIYDADRRVHLIDFDLSTYAPRVLDLAHLLRRSMQQQYWSSEVAYACFLHYNTVRTMTSEEYVIVQALLTFPYRAWRLAHSRYRIFKDDAQVESLKAYESQERHRQGFLSAYAKQVTKQNVQDVTET